MTPDEQSILVDELPEMFLPIPGGWGRMGMPHVRLREVDEEVLAGALQTAWRLRVKKNDKTKSKAPKTKPVVAKPKQRARPSAKE